jgi:hypothetical protein
MTMNKSATSICFNATDTTGISHRLLNQKYGKNNTIGVRFVGNANTMHNGSVENNQGSGLVIEGSNNIATDTDTLAPLAGARRFSARFLWP